MGSGRYGPDDGVAPDPINLGDVTIVSGVEQLIIRWLYTPNTPVELIEIYESATAVRPATPRYIAFWPQDWQFAAGLVEGASMNYWFRVKGVNQRFSAYTGPKNGTVLTWPRISGLEAKITGKITKSAVAPASPSLRDLWIDEGNGNLMKVWDGAAWQPARDQLLTTLNAAVTDPATGLAKTRADLISGAGTWADGDSALATSIFEVAASAALAQGTANAAVTAASTAQAGVNSLAAEYTLQVVTNAGGQRRIAGIRITNQGGAGGATEIVLQADKVALVNSTGDNQIAPFALVDGIVYINTAMIRTASIESAMINSLVADKISAGTLLSMILRAAKTASNSVIFNPDHGVGSTMPAFGALGGENNSSHNIDTTTEHIVLATVYGWATGSGFAANRFSKDAMVFQAGFYSSWVITNYGGGISHADMWGVWRVNGGSWNRMTPQARIADQGNPANSVFGVANISGLSGTDVIEFGVELETPSNQLFNYANISLTWGNL
jgi:hypothetical protein